MVAHVLVKSVCHSTELTRRISEVIGKHFLGFNRKPETTVHAVEFLQRRVVKISHGLKNQIGFSYLFQKVKIRNLRYEPPWIRWSSIPISKFRLPKPVTAFCLYNCSPHCNFQSAFRLYELLLIVTLQSANASSR